VAAEKLEYWLVHKPVGVVTTVRDPEGRRTILELIPEAQSRLFPVGRLDRDTEGLVLLTNDGALAQVLLHPSHETEREYRVTVRGRVPRETLTRLAEGIELDDGRTAPARTGSPAWSAADETTRFSLTLIEGRKRQIRRALAALSHPVVRLVRVRMGPLRLGRLPKGDSRRLRDAEVDALVRLRTQGQPSRSEPAGGGPKRASRRRDRAGRTSSRRSR